MLNITAVNICSNTNSPNKILEYYGELGVSKHYVLLRIEYLQFIPLQPGLDTIKL